MASLGMFAAVDRRAIAYKKINIHPSLWSDKKKPIDIKEFPVRDLSRNEKRATMDQKLSNLYTSSKIKKWGGEKRDGAIWPNTIFGIVRNEKVYRGKITNAWAGVDKEDVDDKIDHGKKVEVTLIDEGHSTELVRKRNLYKLPQEYTETALRSFSKLLTLHLKQPYPLSFAQMNEKFTEIVRLSDGIVFAKPITKAPKQGGGERNVVELYFPPEDYASRKKETFSDLSNLSNINDAVRVPAKYKAFMKQLSKSEGGRQESDTENQDSWDTE